MKRLFMTLAVLSVMVLGAFAEGKFSIRAEQQLSELKESQTRGAAPVWKAFTIYTHEAVEASSLTERIQALGGRVSVAIGHCLTATLPVELWQTMAGWEEVRAIDALSERGALFLDKAHAYTKKNRVDDVALAQTEGLPQEYTGKGTLVAVVDAGIDFNHAAYRTADNHTRIVYGAVLMNNEGGGNMIEEYVFSHEDLENATCVCLLSEVSHGTHTSSIAGGSGMTNGKYRGVAPEADLILIDISAFVIGDGLSGIYEAIARSIQIVDSVATSLDKPVSLSFSVGTSGGAMDEISPEQVALEMFTDHGTRPGRCVSVAAGNNGDKRAHLRYTFKSDTDTLRSVLGTAAEITRNYNHSIEIWSMDETPFTVRLVLRDNNYNIVAESQYFEVTGSNKIISSLPLGETGEKLVYDLSYGFDVVHNRSTLKGPIWFRADEGSEHTMDVLLEIEIISKENASIDMLQYSGTVAFDILGADEWAKMGVELPEAVAKTYHEGDRQQLANSMSISPYVTSVGCGITAMDYKKLDAPEEDFVPPTHFGPLGLQVGDPTAWSNYSTCYSDHSIPHLIAPGALILAAKNRYCSMVKIETYETDMYYGMDMPYGLGNGTSMATPYVAGTAALLLQHNPNYSITEIRDLMTQNTQNKERLHSLDVDPAQYGAGFLDVLATLKAANADPSAIENLKDADADQKVTKYFDGDRLVIDKAGRKYNVAGQRIK